MATVPIPAPEWAKCREEDLHEVVDRLLVLARLDREEGVPSRIVHMAWWRDMQELVQSDPHAPPDVREFYSCPAARSPGDARTVQYLRTLVRIGCVETVGDARPRRYRMTPTGYEQVVVLSVDVLGSDPAALAAGLG